MDAQQVAKTSGVPGERPHPQMTGGGLPWIIVHTKSRQEKALGRDLDRAGLSWYCPVVRELRSHGNRKRWVDSPLFAGYVFAKGGTDTAGALKRTGRVAGLIEVKDQPRLDFELAQIRAAIESGATFISTPYLEKGTPARVIRGALRGLEGIVESLDSPERLILVVHTLGRATSVELSPGDLEPIR